MSGGGTQENIHTWPQDGNYTVKINYVLAEVGESLADI
jgi:hypothetical protein